jgi:sugar lactone lactonase YvrE
MAISSRLTTATRVSPSPDMLGESPIWDHQSQCLYWVDGVSQLIRSYDPATGICRSIPVPSMIGSVGLATEGRMVAGLADGIYLVDLETGQCDPVFQPPTPDVRARFNDGKVDRQGRYVCGSMGIYAEPRGQLYRVDTGGGHQILANGIRIANSLCFSPDGGTIYFADSLDRAIRAYRYGSGDEPLESPRIFVETSAYNSGPDGATVDADGCVWVALVTAGRIARFTPTGQLDRLIEAPTDMPSCMTFGGPDLSTLYVTSIKDSGSGRAISRHPAGGHLFAIEGLGVKGLPEPRFGLRQVAP